MYLYRAVDAEGTTLEFLLSATRDAEAATHCFVKALHSVVCSAPQARPVEEQIVPPMAAADRNTITPVLRVINVDKHAAYPKAMANLKASAVLPESAELRQVKYLNNIVEQDHRFIKRLVKPGMGFFSFETADRTLQGDEVMCMMRKGQVREGGQSRHQRAGHLHRQPVWSGSLSPTTRGGCMPSCCAGFFATQPSKSSFRFRPRQRSRGH
jgi:transposase, IS6 family